MKGKRFINWLVYNVVFACIPLFSVWFFRVLADKPQLDINSDFPEVLFFTLMICVTTLSDLKAGKIPQKWNGTIHLMDATLILAVIVIAIMYGGLRYGGILNPTATYRVTILNGIIYFTVAVFVVSFVCQIILMLIQRPISRRPKSTGEVPAR